MASVTSSLLIAQVILVKPASHKKRWPNSTRDGFAALILYGLPTRALQLATPHLPQVQQAGRSPGRSVAGRTFFPLNDEQIER